MNESKSFQAGDLVEKHVGEARYIGVVVAAYPTLAGADRVVVDVLPQRFQMIGSGDQLRLLRSGLTREQAIIAGVTIVAQRAIAELGTIAAAVPPAMDEPVPPPAPASVAMFRQGGKPMVGPDRPASA